VETYLNKNVITSEGTNRGIEEACFSGVEAMRFKNKGKREHKTLRTVLQTGRRIKHQNSILEVNYNLEVTCVECGTKNIINSAQHWS
jgi:hypothetical protein